MGINLEGDFGMMGVDWMGDRVELRQLNAEAEAEAVPCCQG